MTASSLVQPLGDGPIDIVGDVHGELEPLRQLLDGLGYSVAGGHPEQRRLVFVGDLTDRGPDSPGVIDLVRSLVGGGVAQCVLGNHDLNLLLNERKYDNGWFFGEALPDGRFRTRLAALRLPERVLLFDDGHSEPLPRVN